MITLRLVDYDPAWPEQFETHREHIARALGDRPARIEHIGSTSVPGLAAKPVIDLIVGGIEPGDAAVRAALDDAGYALIVDEPGHAMFRPADGSAHVHVWAEPEEFERHLLFRDWLRAHPEDRALYEHVKREFVRREWETSNHYAEAKTAVVNTIMRHARGEENEARIERFAEIVLRHTPPRARILEIGAGEGLLAARLAAAGHEVVALDTQLRSMFPIVESSFEDFQAPAHSFACIVAQLVLHHAGDLNETLDKIVCLLKPGGIIAIDDYGWERSTNEQFREQRSDLLTSGVMLSALKQRFTEIFYDDHEGVTDGTDNDRLAFTFLGRLSEE